MKRAIAAILMSALVMVGVGCKCCGKRSKCSDCGSSAPLYDDYGPTLAPPPADQPPSTFQPQ